MPAKNEISPALRDAIVASGIRYEQVDNYPLTGIKAHLQVRHNTDASGNTKYDSVKITEYKAKYKSGNVPPHIGVTRDGVLVWGNHRSEAARKAEMADIPAWVLNIDGVDPDDHTLALLMQFSGRENAGHGLPLTGKDKELIIRQELSLGTTSGVIQQTYGWTAAQVSGLKREMDAEKRLSDLGVLSALQAARKEKSIIRAFSGPNTRALTNAPYKNLVELTIDAGLTAKDINQIAETAKAAGTEDGAIAVVAAKRKELDRQIAEIATGGTLRPTPISRLRKVVTEVAGLCDKFDPATYRDHTVDAEATKESINAAIGCLIAIRDAQEV